MPDIQWDVYWANAPRSAVITMTYAIPEVGSLISKAIDMFWPEAKPDMKDLIAASEERMKAWIQSKIGDYDRKQREEDLSGFRENLKVYAAEKAQKQRQIFMNNLIMEANELKPHFLAPAETVNPQDFINSLTLVREFAISHMLLLRERVLFVKEIFGDDDVPIDTYKQELDSEIKVYQDYIVKAVSEVMKWRKDQISIVNGGFGTSKVKLTDNARDVVDQWVDPGLITQYNAFLLNQAQVELTKNYLDVARAWSLLSPGGQEIQPIPNNRQIYIGPVGVSLWDACENSWFNNFSNGLGDLDHPGRIKDIVAKRDNALSLIFFEYDGGRRGKVLGHALNGEYNKVVVPEGANIRQVDTYWMVSCRGIQFHFTDGTASKFIGDQVGVPHTASFPDHILMSVAIYGNEVACLDEIYYLFQPNPATF